MHSRGSYPAYLGALLGDPEVAEALSAQAQLKAMIEVEAALAAVQAELGLIPTQAAAAISALARDADVTPEELAETTRRDGIPIPGLLARLREALPAEHAVYLHWGATSQDIIDSASCLTLCQMLDIFSKRLDSVTTQLAELADAHRGSVMAARTRGQQATPTTFGLKAAGWLAPLIRHAERLPRLRREALPLSFGGASGTQAAYGPNAAEIERRMAERLGLTLAVMPWHAQREGMIEAGCWLAAVAGSLGKMAGDILLLTQSEVGEVRLANAGGSSTMPNKANPTGAETIVALARHAATEVGGLQQTALHAQERDGAAWMLEWLSLPPLAEASGCALVHSQALLDNLRVDDRRMRLNIEASNGLLLAEAASFALAVHMPRPEAQCLVKQACQETLDSGVHLIDVLQRHSQAPVDWQRLRDPRAQVGASDCLIDQVLAALAQARGNNEGRRL